MATSGTTTWTLSGDEIVTQAFQRLGITGVEGDTITNANLEFGTTILNSIMKNWAVDTLHLFTRTEGVLFLDQDVNTYSLSNASTSAKACLLTDAIITTTNAAEAAAQTSITVTSSTGMATSDNVGIVLDTLDIHWSTISSVTDSTTIVIADALPSAAADGNNVYTFTNRITRPMRIFNMRRVTGTSADTNGTDELVLGHLSHERYFNITSKLEGGEPNSWYYDPQQTTGKLYLYPTPDDCSVYIRFTYDRPMEDFVTGTDNADLPVEWIEPLIMNLMAKIAITPAYQVDIQRAQFIYAEAEKLRQQVLGFDAEQMSVQFVPDLYNEN